MAREEDVQRLEARIVELEDQLKAVRATREPMDISAEELQAFHKVSDTVGLHREWIRICACTTCICSPCIPCVRCDVECSCGPCAMGGGFAGGGGRFGGLGR